MLVAEKHKEIQASPRAFSFAPGEETGTFHSPRQADGGVPNAPICAFFTYEMSTFETLRIKNEYAQPALFLAPAERNRHFDASRRTFRDPKTDHPNTPLPPRLPSKMHPGKLTKWPSVGTPNVHIPTPLPLKGEPRKGAKMNQK